MKRRQSLILLGAFAITGLAWFMLRVNIESRLEFAAARELRTIIDLVATDIGTRAGDSPGLKGDALARHLAGAKSEFAQSLERVMAEHAHRGNFHQPVERDALRVVLRQGQDGVGEIFEEPLLLFFLRVGEFAAFGALFEKTVSAARFVRGDDP